MSVELKVAELRRFKKRLGEVKISLSDNKDKTCRMRWGRKYIMMDAPNRQIAEKIRIELLAVITRNAENVGTIIEHVERSVEQMELGLFGEKSQEQNEKPITIIRESTVDKVMSSGAMGDTGDFAGTITPETIEGAE